MSVEPFVFRTEARLVVLTGRRARNLPELLDQLTQVSGSCIFYHTHYLYLVQHFVKPRFYNDFANWASHSLQEERLAEQLAAIDLLAITSIRELRESIIATLRKHLERSPNMNRECRTGDEFHFCEAKSFIMTAGPAARDPAEFFEQIPKVSNACIHFHCFEARLRLEKTTNDFSQWLTAAGESSIAKKIDKLNPYAMTLDELKMSIAKLGRGHLRK